MTSIAIGVICLLAFAVAPLVLVVYFFIRKHCRISEVGETTAKPQTTQAPNTDSDEQLFPQDLLDQLAGQSADELDEEIQKSLQRISVERNLLEAQAVSIKAASKTLRAGTKLSEAEQKMIDALNVKTERLNQEEAVLRQEAKNIDERNRLAEVKRQAKQDRDDKNFQAELARQQKVREDSQQAEYVQRMRAKKERIEDEIAELRKKNAEKEMKGKGFSVMGTAVAYASATAIVISLIVVFSN
jgi:uncharacterized protein (DUF3084 family)